MTPNTASYNKALGEITNDMTNGTITREQMVQAAREITELYQTKGITPEAFNSGVASIMEGLKQSNPNPLNPNPQPRKKPFGFREDFDTAWERFVNNGVEGAKFNEKTMTWDITDPKKFEESRKKQIKTEQERIAQFTRELNSKRVARNPSLKAEVTARRTQAQNRLRLLETALRK